MKGYHHIIILLLAFTLSGCIRDDGTGEDCDRTQISFCYYGDSPEQACRFVDKTDQVTLFVYDNTGNLVMSRTKDNAALSIHKGMNLNLPDGEYYLVAWTNITDCTEAHETGTLSAATLGNGEYYAGNPVIRQENDRLYYASKKITVVQSEYRHEEMKFQQAHIPLRIHIIGAAAPTDTRSPGGAPVEMDVSNLHPQMGFDGASTASLTCIYRPDLSYDTQTGSYTATVHAFRFSDENDIELKLSNVGGTICYKTVRLADFMNEHAISVDDKDEAEIAIRFRFNNTSVEIAPWEEGNIDPEQK